MSNGKTKETYRVGIVGLTGIGAGKPHTDVWYPRFTEPATHASAYAACSRTQVVAVCDLVPELLDGYVENWGPATTYTDYRAMLEKENLDLISVVTSDHLHAQIVVDAAEAGVKGIYCDKPLATTLEDADRMLATVEKHGIPMSVNYGRRWDPFWLQAKMIVEEGRIGSLTRIVGHLGGGRAMMFRNGCHMIDAVCYFAESDPAWLIGEMEEGYESRTEYRGDGGHDPDTDPGASAYIHFANGIRGYLDMSKRTMVNLEVELFCEKGRIRISNGEAVVYIESENKPGEVTSRQLGGRMVYTGAMLGAVEELVDLVENGGESISSGREAMRSLEIMIAIGRSQFQGVEKITWPLAR